jgi:hypothetical protein
VTGELRYRPARVAPSARLACGQRSADAERGKDGACGSIQIRCFTAAGTLRRRALLRGREHATPSFPGTALAPGRHERGRRRRARAAPRGRSAESVISSAPVTPDGKHVEAVPGEQAA